MTPDAPLQNFGELVERFPGIEQLEPNAVGRFAFYVAQHTPSESFLRGDTEEPHEDWHWDVNDVLHSVLRWKEYPGGLSRYDLAKQITDTRQREKEERDTIQGIETTSADEGLAIAMGYLRSRGVVVTTELEASPLFTDGREVSEPLEKYIDAETGKLYIPYGSKMFEKDGERVPTGIEQFIERGYGTKKSAEVIQAALEQLEPIDNTELARLTKLYGAKAAALLCFEKRFTELLETIGSGRSVTDMEIPPFTAVSTHLYIQSMEDRYCTI